MLKVEDRKKEKQNFRIFPYILAFGILVNCRENGDELAGFVEQIGHLCRGHAAAVHQEFEPILGFLNFLEAVADLGSELGFSINLYCSASR